MAAAVTPTWIYPSGDQSVTVQVYGYSMEEARFEVYRALGRPSGSTVTTSQAGTLIGEFVPGSGPYVEFDDLPPARDTVYTYWVFGFAPDGTVAECTPYVIRNSCFAWGRVTDASGTPVPQSAVTLWLEDSSGWSSFETTLTDSDGTYGLLSPSGHPLFALQVSASDPAHDGPATFFGGGFYPESAPRLNSIPANADIVLDRSFGVITGRAHSLLDGSAIGSATVSIYSGPAGSSSNPVGSVLTSADGSYSAFVSPGLYRVSAQRSDYLRASSESTEVPAAGSRDLGDLILEPAWDYKPPVTTDTYDGGWVRPAVQFVLNWTHIFGPYYQSVPTTTTVQFGDDAPFVYSGPITWSTSGETTMTYASISTNNVPEATHTVILKVDGDAPVTVAETDSVGGGTCVTLHAADAVSGVQRTWLEVDGVAQPYSAPVTISAAGSHTVRYWSEDYAGNWETPQTFPVEVAGDVPAPHGDPLLSREWWLPRMEVSRALAAEPATTPVTVAVIAGGFDLTNPDLKNSWWTNPGEIAGNGVDDDGNGVVDDVHGASFSDSAIGTDLTGSGYAESCGTMLAGLIAAGQDDGIGIRGIAPNARIMAVRCEDYYTYEGIGELATGKTLARCIDYAVDNGARVVVCDASDENDPESPDLASTVTHAADHGVLIFVTGTGGGGPFISWPGSSDATNVIDVGAMDSNGGTGDLMWGAAKPLFAAPAYDIVGPSQVRSAGIIVHHGAGTVLKLGFEPQFIQDPADRSRIMVASAEMITPEKDRPVIVIGNGANQWVDALSAAGWQHVSVFSSPYGPPNFSAFKGCTVIWGYDETFGWNLYVPQFLEAGGRLLTSGGRGSTVFEGFSPYYPMGAYEDPAHPLLVRISSGAPSAGTTSTLPVATANTRFNLYEVVDPDSSDAKTVFEYNDDSAEVNPTFAAGSAGGIAAYLIGADPSLSAADVRARLVAGVRPNAAMNGITTTGGELDMFYALAGPPPVTELFGTTAGWVNHDVTVSLTTSAAPSAEVSSFYGLNAPALSLYSSPIQVSTEGTTTINYFSVGPFGNAEQPRSATVTIDRTAPVTSADARPSYVSLATIHLSASDALSGVASTHWVLDGTQGSGSTVSTSTLGSHTLEYCSTDSAGNAETTHTIVFRVVERTCPTKVIVSNAPNGRVNKSYRFALSVVPSSAGGRMRIALKRLVGRKWKSAGSATLTLSGGRGSYFFRPKYKGTWEAAVSYGGQSTGAETYLAAPTVTKAFKVK